MNQRLTKTSFHKDILRLDNPEATINSIVTKLRNDTYHLLNRFGGVVGISGGIDSSVTLALAVKALSPDKVLGIMLPEKDSNPESERLALKLAEKFGIKAITENISTALSGFGCYERRDQAVKNVFPEYNPEKHKMKIAIKTALHSKLPPLYSVVIIDEKGVEFKKKLPAKEFLQIVASSNFKQRTRMTILYYHAERLHYAVIGTPNKHEVDQGFFVKYGDGGADIMPIAHLYKTQVYQLAEFMGIPQEIIERMPTTDTYSAEQTQEEFFFQIPFYELDLLWYAFENGYSYEEVGKALDMLPKEVESIFLNFKRKRVTTNYLRMGPIKNL